MRALPLLLLLASCAAPRPAPVAPREAEPDFLARLADEDPEVREAAAAELRSFPLERLRLLAPADREARAWVDRELALRLGNGPLPAASLDALQYCLHHSPWMWKDSMRAIHDGMAVAPKSALRILVDALADETFVSPAPAESQTHSVQSNAKEILDRLLDWPAPGDWKPWLESIQDLPVEDLWGGLAWPERLALRQHVFRWKEAPGPGEAVALAPGRRAVPLLRVYLEMDRWADYAAGVRVAQRAAELITRLTGEPCQPPRGLAR